jgi:ClpP class serine protease
MLQPVLRKRMLEAKRWRRIGQLERRRGSRVVLLVHRQETMQLLGFPLVRYIDIHDSEKVLRAIHTTDPNVPLDIILHTPGGLVLAAIQIARAFCDHKAKVTVFVPLYAMSGGTLIALAADEIVMSKHAVLGPIDPQIGQFPAASLIKVVEQKPVAEIDDNTLIMADVGRRRSLRSRPPRARFWTAGFRPSRRKRLRRRCHRDGGRMIIQSRPPRPNNWACR